MRGALEKVDGIGPIDIKKGDKDFTVHYDPKKIQPAAMVEKLIAAGKPASKVKA